MKTTRLLFLGSLSLAPAFAGYTYDFPNQLNPYNSGQWSATGSISASSNMVTSADANGGSLIFNNGLPAPSNSYEVRTTLSLNASGGHYITYLRGSSGSILGGAGSFYAVEIANPTISAGGCTATLNVYKQTGAGTLTNPYSVQIWCHNGMVVRAIVITANVVAVFIDNFFWTSWGWGDSTPITSGQPGVGVSGAPSGNGISAIDIGHMDTVAPNPINAQLVGFSAFPNHVDFQFPGTVDDPNGIGIAYYQYWRNGNWLNMSLTPNLSDTTVAPNTTYTYVLQAQDYHYNNTSVTITVTTPPAGEVDPREVGVRPLGSYWGGAGEQVDMRAFNLNYTVPLVKAMARSGWSASFNLSYNSQNWRQDSGGIWALGRDVGYGYGWRLQAGSLTPVYRDYWTIDHYLFIDSTGAEYRLNVNTNGVWTSQESIYVSYDTSTGRLYFPDGSFWTFGSVSAGTEQDSGALYPTLMEDTNGNQVVLTYNAGAGVTWTNSSARIATIQDLRGTFNFTYGFIYPDDPIPHLSQIRATLTTPQIYNFSIASRQPLSDPFVNGSAGNTAILQSLTQVGTNLTTSFATNGSGELTQMTTPYGGHLRWTYGQFTYVGNRTQREVNNRYLSASAGAPETLIGMWNDPGDPNHSFHTVTATIDWSVGSEKIFSFQTDNTQFNYGLSTNFELRPKNDPAIAGSRHEGYTWSLNATNNPYISAVLTTEDDYNPTAVQKKTTQTIDAHGNLTQMQVYDFGNLSTPARTYTNTYLTDSNYTSRYIFNRLLSSTVTDGTRTTTLSQINYDAVYPYVSDPSNGYMPMHDSSYGTGFYYRGNPTYVVTPGGSSSKGFDMGGNVTSSTTNGVTTTSTTSTNTYWAAPTAITTGTLSTGLNWTPYLAPNQTTGPNGDSATVGYDGNARPSHTVSPTGAWTDYTYLDTQSPPMFIATVSGAGINSHWSRTTKDGFGRTIKAETGSGTGSNTATATSVVDTVYGPCGCNPMGKMQKVSQPHAPGATPVWTTYNYDGLGRTIATVAPDVGATPTNLAQGKTATQSSTYDSITGASNAVDGNTDGSYSHGSITHTNYETNAWWQVDLGVSASISSITIWNRTDCCMDRLSDYWVFISRTPFSPSDTPATLQTNPNIWNNHQTSYPNPSATLSAPNFLGRYVRVQLSGTNFLSLAEVQVFGVYGSTTTYSYSGNTVTVTDPAGKSKTFTMDALGNLTQVQDGSGTTTYTYDMLNHLTSVSMPRNGYTQTRTFNYNPNSTTVGVDLLSATNPENGTVTYTYNSDHTLATKTDAKNQVFTFGYDGYKRLTSVSVGGNTLRTYSYDSNPFDGSYSQYTAGRLTAIQYNAAINYNLNPGTGSTSFIDMFSYSQPGQLTGKRLRVTKTTQYLSQTQTATADLNLTYGYNAEGKMVSIGYPNGPSYTYSFDNMMRPSGMTDQSNIAVVNNVQYGPANELLSMTMPSAGTETRTYNSMLQLTSISGMGQNVTYTFPSATNNGKISSQTDNLSGETVTYQYDSLNRLIQASGSGWSQSQSYDGFGNLTNRSGTMPMSTPVDPATNRLSMAGVNYDANGNMTSNGYYAYDAENRLTQINSGQTQYGYDAQNKRIWQGSFSNNGDWYLTSDTISLFGIDGKLIGTYQPQQSQTTLSFNVITQRVYFGSKLIGTVDGGGNLSAVVQDRLGSRGKYYPYGEERNSPQLQNDQVKFATYTRDSATGLDYADQRYYASTFGRFATPDPYKASAAGLKEPADWNRYVYSGDDPMNRNDPSGLYYALIWSGWCEAPNEDLYWCEQYTFVGFLGGGGAAGAKKKKDTGDIRDPDSTDCDPQVIQAMKKAWMQSMNGTTGVEATFVLVGTADNYTIVQIPFTNQVNAQAFTLPAGTFAIYHVHPNGTDPSPSPADQALANRFDLSINAMSSQGLYEYDPDTKFTTQLARGLDWMKPCPKPNP